MKHTKETLEELDDYIEMLDEKVGLKPEVVLEIKKAISLELDKIKRKELKVGQKHISRDMHPYVYGNRVITKIENGKVYFTCEENKSNHIQSEEDFRKHYKLKK